MRPTCGLRCAMGRVTKNSSRSSAPRCGARSSSTTSVSGVARTLAIVVLVSFGAVLLIPELGERLQAPLSRLARFGPRTRGDGFWSGVAVGGALGFVCAPCAGPILAAVTSVSASGGASIRVVVVALGYAAGLSAMMLLYALGGRAVLDRVRRRARGHVVERALGVILVATA